MNILSRLTCILLASVATVAAAEITKIAPKDAAQLVAEGKAILVDVREPAEWAETGVAAPAVLLAKSDFDGERRQWAPFLGKNAGKQIILYCRSGRRADAVGQALAAEGRQVANAGGLKDWQAAGLPIRPVAKP